MTPNNKPLPEEPKCDCGLNPHAIYCAKNQPIENKKLLGIKYSIGKYGIKFGRPQAPDGQKRGWKFVQIIPLDGWLFGDEMIKEMRKRGFEL